MQILEPYIPKEYLALRINYCKKILKDLPEVMVSQRLLRGKKIDVCVSDSHYYRLSSATGKNLLLCSRQREELLRELAKLEGLWESAFRGLPPPDIEPRKIRRSFLNNNNETVILDGNFFESLKNDANPYFPDSKKYFYNGTYYRSAAEVDIARFYTEQGIPFKYEPEIWLKGLNHPIYTDFVLLIKELDLCKFHEHFGMKNFSGYAAGTLSKYTNYSEAGLVMDFDVICTYNYDSVPFDLRMLSTKLNHAVYDSLFALDIPF